MNVPALIIAIVDILVCIMLIMLVIFQEGNSKGLGVIGGGAETFFGKSKGRGIDAKLKKFTTYTAIICAALTITVYLITR